MNPHQIEDDLEWPDRLQAARRYLPPTLLQHWRSAPILAGWLGPQEALFYCTFPQFSLFVQAADGTRQRLRSGPECGPAWQRWWEESGLARLHLQCWLDAASRCLYAQADGRCWRLRLDQPEAQMEVAGSASLPPAQGGMPLMQLTPGMALLCPQQRYQIQARDHNLYLHDAHTGNACWLTCDGTEQAQYGLGMYFGLQVKQGVPQQSLNASFSPDGRYLLSYRLDLRGCSVRQILRQDDKGPQAVSWPEVMSGDEHVPLARLCLFDLEQKRAIELDLPSPQECRFAMFDADYSGPFFLQQICWEQGRLYLLPWARGRRACALLEVDPASGACHTRYVHSSPSLLHYPLFGENWLVAQGQVFCIAEAGGWPHAHLLQNGQLKQLTHGEWAVRQILGFADGWLYFCGGGREADVSDPYYRQLYRLQLRQENGTWQLAGSEQRIYGVDADLQVQAGPDCRHFIVTSARFDQAPRTLWIDQNGQQLQLVGEGAFDSLPWQTLHAVRTPAAPRAWAPQAQGDLHGLLCFPAQFDPARSYPLIVTVYPGCHTTTVPKRLEPASRQLFFMQSLAALGCFVLRVDGMGGPGRSQAWHDVCWRHLDDATLPDQVAALRHVASLHPQIDLTRVAIIGSSAGGYTAARAMFTLPDVFALGVAAAGNHELLKEGAEWTEDYGGWPLDKAQLAAHSNAHLAPQLQGRLLLVHGMLDDNVSVGQSLELSNALLAAGRQFDMLISPDGDHQLLMQDQVQEFVWRYVRQHLIKQPASTLAQA
ncbi:prolyl oligopeptidase family serine peptidase [Massilia sp. W12]|uniref:S9 family peptidase n=1 Tax=Massilia sp. W12 TaxID=3126507 RepID=UPI0030D0E920